MTEIQLTFDFELLENSKMIGKTVHEIEEEYNVKVESLRMGFIDLTSNIFSKETKIEKFNYIRVTGEYKTVCTFVCEALITSEN